MRSDQYTTEANIFQDNYFLQNFTSSGGSVLIRLLVNAQTKRRNGDVDKFKMSFYIGEIIEVIFYCLHPGISTATSIVTRISSGSTYVQIKTYNLNDS